jgi:hypothetical protein
VTRDRRLRPSGIAGVRVGRPKLGRVSLLARERCYLSGLTSKFTVCANLLSAGWQGRLV